MRLTDVPPSDAMDVDRKTFIPGRDKLQNGESLQPDTSAYEMLHTFSTTWPCLSFDVVRDGLGDGRKSYPATVYAVAGTQAESRRAKDNELLVVKLSGLSRTERPDQEMDSDKDDDSSDEASSDPILETRSIPLPCTTNRIRAHQIPPLNSSAKSPTTFTATMLENGQLQIHNITPHLTSFDTPGTTITPQQHRPVATLTGHKTEGYALAWSLTSSPQPRLLSGDNDGKIHLTTSSSADGSGKWSMDSRPFTGHEGSVEDIAWSPSERTVFTSASSDGTVKIWDTRSKSRTAAISVKVSDTDVNVLAWSAQTAHLLATGADDGQWAVWDLRHWKPLSNNSSKKGTAAVEDQQQQTLNQVQQSQPKPVASFAFHKEQITSLEWHPTDDSIVAVAAADNTVTTWDLAVELDDEEEGGGNGGAEADMNGVPPQLMFVHYAESVKECHWHPQIPGVIMATGGEGFGVWKAVDE